MKSQDICLNQAQEPELTWPPLTSREGVIMDWRLTMCGGRSVSLNQPLRLPLEPGDW